MPPKKGVTRHRKVLRDTIQGFTKPALKHLYQRAGAKRISGHVYEESRSIIKVNVENWVRTVVTITEHARRRTVKPVDVLAAARLFGTPLIANVITGVKSERSHRRHRGSPRKSLAERKKERKEKSRAARESKKTKSKSKGKTKEGKTKRTHHVKKPHRFKPGTVALRKIRYYQKKDKLIIPNAVIKRFVKEVAQDFKEELRFSRGALNALHIWLESYLVMLFRFANDAAIHAKRHTVASKDLQFARRLLGERA